MTPDPSDPLFRVLAAIYNRAGIRSVPVESTWERDVLEAHDFELECSETHAHLIGDRNHHGPAAYWSRINVANHREGSYLCAGIVEAIREYGSVKTPCSHGSHTVDDFTFTPLPEGNR